MPFPLDRVYPPLLREAEAQLIRQRRRAAAGLPPEEKLTPQPAGTGHSGQAVEDESPWGLALSGGGIRSATFCLGIVQRLAANEALPRFDFMSTVSGGGFLGSFLGALIQRGGALQKARTPPATEVPPLKFALAELKDDGSPVITWLRESGRYLTPNGATDAWFAAASMLRNWLAIHLVVASTVLLLMLGTQALRTVAVLYFPSWHSLELPPLGWVRLGPWMALAGLLVMIWLLPSAWAYWLTQRSRNFIPPFIGCLSLVFLLAWLAFFPPADTGGWEESYPIIASVVGTAAVLALLLWAGATTWACRLPTDVPNTTGYEHATIGMLFVALGGSLGGLSLILSGVGMSLSRVGHIALVGTALGFAMVGGWLLSLATERDDHRERRQLIRVSLSRWATAALIASVAIATLGLVDGAAETTYAWYARLRASGESLGTVLPLGLAGLLSAVTAIAPWAERIARAGSRLAKTSLSVFAALAAALLTVLYLLLLSFASYGIRWKAGSPDPVRAATWDAWRGALGHLKPPPLGNALDFPEWFLIWLVVMLALVFLMSRLFGFVNTSSLHDFYAARLVRAYLGVSNLSRYRRAAIWPVTRALPGDDIQQEAYHPHALGGPLHLINTTVNETMSGKSQVERQDRKGVPLAVGPAGLSVGTSHHALWWTDPTSGQRRLQPVHQAPGEFEVWQEPPEGNGIESEPLSLGYWIAISGAAFSTGLGSRTSLGTSILAGLFNVRLGYWWDSGVEPRWRPPEVATPLAFGPRLARFLASLLPVQVALLDEFLGRFHGPSRRRWYLTDGGHFENTGCYELIRRRLPLIVLCDCGRDPTAVHEDLANLARRVRADFGAEIEVLTSDELDHVLGSPGRPEWLGDLEQSSPRSDPDQPAPRSKCHAVLAGIRYEDETRKDFSLLLVLKPTITGDEPVDLGEYQARHREFPHETTTDQFFDEAQWESYRRLGVHIGDLAAGLLVSGDMTDLRRKVREQLEMRNAT
jgi:hypothetical protein